MAIASITAWLNSPIKNYTHGKLLYHQYGNDRLILTIIESGSGTYHFSKLSEALALLNEQSNLEPKQIVYVPSAAVDADQTVVTGISSVNKVKTNLDDAPPEIRAIRNEKNEKFAEARHALAVARVSDSREHRLEKALLILDNMDIVNESWLAMDTWRETGKITEKQNEQVVASVSELNLQQLLTEEKNLPTYISKARKRHAGHADPVKKTKALAKVQSLISRLNEVKRRINELV